MRRLTPIGRTARAARLGLVVAALLAALVAPPGARASGPGPAVAPPSPASAGPVPATVDPARAVVEPDRALAGAVQASLEPVPAGPAAPWVATDGLDYAPGQVVTISGGDWLPGEAVTLVLREEPPAHPDTVLAALADDGGAFTNEAFVIQPDHVGVAFTLTATGSSGTVATAAFTDALSDFYRSRQSGPWGAASTWESAAAAAGPWLPAAVAPTSASNSIAVQASHTVTVTAAVTVDQVTVAAGGQLTVNGGITVSLGNGTGTDLTINGALAVDGTVAMASSSSLSVNGTMTVGPGASVTGSGTSTANRPTFSVGATGTLSLAAAGTIVATGAGRMSLVVSSGGSATLAGAVTGVDVLTVNGSVASSGGISLSATSNLQVGGSLTLTAGTLALQRGNTGGVGTINSGGTLALQGNAAMTVGTVAGANLAVANGGTLDLAPDAVVGGAGRLVVASGATLRIGSPDGITTGTTTGNVRTAGTDTYSAGATYTYDGAGAQVTGNALPANVANLTIANGAGADVSLTASVTVTGTLTLTAGDLLTSSFTVTQPAAGTSVGVTDVVGTVIRTGLTSGGPARAFGNPATTVQVLSGAAPSQVAVTLAKSIPASPAFPSAIRRTYTIAATGGSGIAAAVQLHYTDAELNGGTDAALRPWRVVAGAWSEVDPAGAATTRNTTASDGIATNNAVRVTGVTSLASAAWTLSSRVPGTFVSDVTFGSDPETPMVASARAMTAWTVGFTTSPAGALVAGDTVTITFDPAFSVDAQSLVPFGGVAGCARSATSVANVVTVTLADEPGATCAIPAASAVTLSVSIVTNPVAGTYAASGFRVRTSKDIADASPAAAVTITGGTSVAGVSFVGSPPAAGARSTWTVGFTASASGALAAGDTITIALPAGFVANPRVTLAGAFSHCANDGGRTLGALILVRLGDHGGTCALAAGGDGIVTIAAVTNGAAGTYAAAALGLGTSKDPVAAHPATPVTVGAATSTTAVSFTGTDPVAFARSAWALAFTTSSGGALAAVDRITVTLPATFVVPAAPTVALGTGFGGCRARAVAAGTTVTITLEDDGTCSAGASTALGLAIADLRNPAAGSHAAPSFGVATTRDTATASASAAVAIAPSTAVTGVSFAGTPQAAGARAAWTTTFTTASAGALAAGDTVSVRLGERATIPAAPPVTLGAAFAFCAGTAATVGRIVTITLENSGGTCSLPASAAGTIRLDGVTNPPAGTDAAAGFGAWTSRDLAFASPSSPIVIWAATAVTGVTFSGAPLAAGSQATWTVGLHPSAAGGLAAGDSIVVRFAPSFVATWEVELGAGLGGCEASVTATGAMVTVTLLDGAGGCGAGGGSAVSLTIVARNPAAGTYPAAGFTVATSRDTAPASPGGAITIP